jgi:CRP/FNR family transcriptional regulator, cyclic AMP receptor protein
MHGPYGLKMDESCQTCSRRFDNYFCQLSLAARKDLNTLKSSSAYPENALLFLERQTPRGVYILCEGEVKLSVSSSEGKTLILRIAEPGEILGLMAALSGNPYEVTAETIRPSLVAFVARDRFLPFLNRHPEVYQSVTKQLGEHYQSACEQLRMLGLSPSVSGRLAKLLLEWSGRAPEATHGNSVKMHLTHQEIAECIGTTRETVTRALAELRNRQLVVLQGATLTIRDRGALETLVAA